MCVCIHIEIHTGTQWHTTEATGCMNMHMHVHTHTHTHPHTHTHIFGWVGQKISSGLSVRCYGNVLL